MDKQKQILEIAEVIAKYISSRDFEVKFITNPKSKAFPFSHTAGVAEDLINAGYRKIPEGAIVLTREEKKKLLHEMYKQGKFDAVAKFAERVKTCKIYSQAYIIGKGITVSRIIEDITVDEIAKELTEGEK